MMLSYVIAISVFDVYIARFVSEIAVPKEWMPFSTFEEFLADGSYKLRAIPNSAQYSYFNVRIEHHSDSLLKLYLKKVVLKKVEGFAPLTQKIHSQESHYKQYLEF